MTCKIEKEDVNKFDKKFTDRDENDMKKIVALINESGAGLDEKERKKKQKEIMTMHSAYPVEVICFSFSYFGY